MVADLRFFEKLHHRNGDWFEERSDKELFYKNMNWIDEKYYSRVMQVTTLLKD